MVKKVLFILILIGLVPFVFAEGSVERYAPTQVGYGEEFAITYTIKGEGDWIMAFEDYVSGECSPEKHRDFLTGSGEDLQIREATFNATGSHNCILEGTYLFLDEDEGILRRHSITIIGAPCVPDWSCSSWSSCSGSQQTRTCVDLNNCGANDLKPIETQPCSSGGGGSSGGSGGRSGSSGSVNRVYQESAPSQQINYEIPQEDYNEDIVLNSASDSKSGITGSVIGVFENNLGLLVLVVSGILLLVVLGFVIFVFRR